jgi:hypothetical protein
MQQLVQLLPQFTQLLTQLTASNREDWEADLLNVYESGGLVMVQGGETWEDEWFEDMDGDERWEQHQAEGKERDGEGQNAEIGVLEDDHAWPDAPEDTWPAEAGIDPELRAYASEAWPVTEHAPEVHDADLEVRDAEQSYLEEPLLEPETEIVEGC